MAIGDGMLAQILLDYLHQHAEEFEQFVLERTGIGEGYVRWRGEETQKRLVLKVTTLGSGPSIVAEREYALKIATIYIVVNGTEVKTSLCVTYAFP